MDIQADQLTFERFRREDFPVYQSWFADPELNQHLGPMESNDPWLEEILASKDGVEFCIFKDGEMLAELGVLFPTEAFPAFYITNLAVRPDLRGMGIGSMVLQKAIALFTKNSEYWRCFVDQNNPKAIAFLLKNSWKRVNEQADEHGMFEFIYPT